MIFKILSIFQVVPIYLMFLSGCNQPCEFWEYNETITSCPQYNSAIITIPPQERPNSAYAEFVRSSFGIRMHLNLLCFVVPTIDEEGTKSTFTVFISDQTFSYVGDLLEGGQRLLVPPDATELITQALLEGVPVVIKLGLFKIELMPDNFGELYCKLISFPV